MAVPEQTPYKEYTANGSTTSFALGFICDSKNDLIVLVDNVAPPVATWSLVGNNAVFTTAPASGKKIILQRNTAMSRTTNYQGNNNSFRPETINKDIDRVWLKLQELGVADMLLKIYVDRLHGEQKDYIDNKDHLVRNIITDLRNYVNQQDGSLSSDINNLRTHVNQQDNSLAQSITNLRNDTNQLHNNQKNYIDQQDNNRNSYFENLISRQGVSLQQLDSYYNYLMRRIAQIAVDKGWDASFVVDASGKTQQEVNNVLFTRIAHIKDFGAIGDGASHPLSEKFATLAQAQAVYPFATSLTQQIDMCAFQLMVNTYPNNCILNFTGMSLYAGSFSRASPRVLIDSPVNMQLIGNGCITSGTTADQRAVCYAVKNPNNFKALDFEFTDPNFDVNLAPGGNRSGYYGFAFFADETYSSANPCEGVEVTGKAENTLGFAIVEGTTALGITSAFNYNAIKDVVCRYTGKNIYYGFSTIYGSVGNIVFGNCHNVKRGFISYGTNNSDVNLKLFCDPGFVGSDAFVELAQEGESKEALHDVSIKLRVSGCEAHSDYVTFFHQQPEQNGKIYNVDAFVVCDNLTSVGKNPLVSATNIFTTTWHNGTSKQTETNRLIDNIKLDCLVRGVITGRAFTAPATPLNKTGRLFFGNGLCEALNKDYISLGLWTNFKVLSGSISVPFLTPPVITGVTSLGTATYSTQKGIVSIRDGQAFYNIDLVWTAHTGEGFAVVSGLPVRAQPNLSVGQTPVSVQDTGFTGLISALVAGAGLNQLVLYSKDTATGLSPRANLPTAGAFKASFNFSLYN